MQSVYTRRINHARRQQPGGYTLKRDGERPLAPPGRPQGFGIGRLCEHRARFNTDHRTRWPRHSVQRVSPPCSRRCVLSQARKVLRLKRKQHLLAHLRPERAQPVPVCVQDRVLRLGVIRKAPAIPKEAPRGRPAEVCDCGIVAYGRVLPIHDLHKEEKVWRHLGGLHPAQHARSLPPRESVDAKRIGNQNPLLGQIRLPVNCLQEHPRTVSGTGEQSHVCVDVLVGGPQRQENGRVEIPPSQRQDHSQHAGHGTPTHGTP